MPPQPVTRRHLVGQMRRRLDSGIAPVVVVRGPRQNRQDHGAVPDDPGPARRRGRPEADSSRPVRRPRDSGKAAGTDPSDFGLVRTPACAEAVQQPGPRRRAGLPVFRRDPEPETLGRAVEIPGRQRLGQGGGHRELGPAHRAGARFSRRPHQHHRGGGSLPYRDRRPARPGTAGPLPAGQRPGRPSAERGSGPVCGNTVSTMEHSARKRSFISPIAADIPWSTAKKDAEFSQLSDQLNETVIKRVIQHGLRTGERGRKRDENLLEELFRLVCRYAGQTPRAATLAEEARLALGANIGSQRVTQYLKFLGDTLLLRLVPPLEIRLKRRRGSPKLCLVDHGLRASWLQERIPLVPGQLAQRPELTTMAGHLAESVFGSVAATIHGLDIAHFPARGTDQEMDFVLTVGSTRIPVEVKYQRRIDSFRDTLGLRSFLEKFGEQRAVRNSRYPGQLRHRRRSPVSSACRCRPS